MRYLQYKGLVEREFKKSLKKIMYETCVTEGLNASEGAKKLGVAKEIFVFWRKHYRFEKNQLLFDETVESLNHLPYLYADDVKKIDLKRPLIFKQEESVRGLEELIERTIEHYKYLHYESEGLSRKAAVLPFYEFSQEVVEDYRDGTLLKKVESQSGSRL